jgi:hypothetical protein
MQVIQNRHHEERTSLESVPFVPGWAAKNPARKTEAEL